MSSIKIKALTNEIIRLQSLYQDTLRYCYKCQLCDNHELIDGLTNKCFNCGVITCNDCYKICSCKPIGAPYCIKCLNTHEGIKH